MTNDLFRYYMLNPTDEAQRDQLRERLLADQAFSDQIRDQENDWIDAYSTGKLTPADAALLYQHLANTGQLHRIPTAAALVQPKPAPRSIFPYAFAIAAMALVCFGIAHQFQQRTNRPEIAVTQPPEPVLVTVALVPGALRAGQKSPEIHLEQNQRTLLQLQYQDIAPSGKCRVTLEAQSTPNYALNRVDNDCGLDFHPYDLPADTAPGRYTIRLTNAAGELIHTYNITVTR